MQVNAINSQITGSARNFTGKRDNIEAFINLNDGEIQLLPDGKGLEGFYICRMRKD